MTRSLAALGAEVRRARHARGMTLKLLSEASGISERFLSDLERGRANISIGRLVEVAEALGVSVSELVECLDAVKGAARRSIALIGLRGAGKSTIGKQLADRLGLRFVELDEEIERRAGLPLGQIFELHGESYYRRLEREVLGKILAGKPVVVATGGGIVTDPESWSRLRTQAKTIWLRALPEDHYRRVMEQGDTRPMANRPAAMAELRALLSSRSRTYEQAELVVDTSALGIEGSTDKLVDLMRG